MSHEFLLILYLLLFVVQILLLVRAWKGPRLGRWLGLYALELGSIAGAAGCFVYYNAHPGYLMSTLGHVLWSMGALGLFCAMVAVTALVHLCRYRRK